MPRANRHFLPGQLWHITHRCHKKSFLLKFGRDRRACLSWRFEAKKRFGHPAQWAHGGYREIPNPRDRYSLIDLPGLSVLCGFGSVGDFQRAYRRWVEEALTHEAQKREARWSEAIAVGSQAFVERVKRELGMHALHREIDATDGTWALREPENVYTSVFGPKNSALRPKNTVFWSENPVNILACRGPTRDFLPEISTSMSNPKGIVSKVAPLAFAALFAGLSLLGCGGGGAGGVDSNSCAAAGTCPSVPTVSLVANPTSVTSGGSSMLTWFSTNATSCIASGDWSGAKATSGVNVSTGALTSIRTFTLSCTGTGGTASASATVTVSGACSGFYAPGFALVSGKRNDPVPSVSKPLRGQAFAEPTYGTCMTRATDHVADNAVSFTRNDYSRRQAFNSDNSKFVVNTGDGSWWLYDASTYAFIRVLTQLGGDAEAQWHPTNPDLLYYLPNTGGLVVNELNVLTGQSRIVGDFSGNRLPWAGAAHVWTKSEGSPSADGRYWAFMVEDSNYDELGFIVWDLTTDTIISSYTTNKRPDHLSMSPTGNYVVVSWDDGVIVFDRDFTNPRLVHPVSEHSDIALDANGDDVYISVDYQAGDGAIYMRNLRTGVRTDLFPTYLDGGASAFHFSGKAFNKPGWVLISSYADFGPPEWLYRKVFVVKLSTTDPTIYNLAHTHEIYNGYFTEPHASVNRNFTKILFNSNWDVNSSTDIDVYMIDIPAGVLN